jgi:hypothetical protein
VRPRLSATLVLTGLLGGGSAFATETSPGDPASADVLFREGRSLIAAGDYPHACPKFAESLRLDHAPGTLLSLADCEEHTRRIATAWGHFRELSRELPRADERQPFADQRAAALEPRLPHLTVRSSSSLPSVVKVWRDDQELDRASLDVALPVDPGIHTVMVSQGDQVLYRIEVEVLEGQSRTISAVPSGYSEPGPTMSARRIAGWITGGLAVTALATGAYFGVSAVVNNDTAACAGGSCTSAASAQTYDDARSQARVADVALGIGLVATATAGYLLFTSRKSDAPPTSSARLASLALGRVTW